MTHTEGMLDFIPSMAQELPALVMGESTTVDRLMLAASVCGWITDYERCDGATWGRGAGDKRKHGVVVESGIDDDGKPFVLMVEYENKEIINAICFDEGCTAEDLADIGRVFLNAAIAVREAEKDD